VWKSLLPLSNVLYVSDSGEVALSMPRWHTHRPLSCVERFSAWELQLSMAIVVTTFDLTHELRVILQSNGGLSLRHVVLEKTFVGFVLHLPLKLLKVNFLYSSIESPAFDINFSIFFFFCFFLSFFLLCLLFLFLDGFFLLFLEVSFHLVSDSRPGLLTESLSDSVFELSIENFIGN
jgi:hypothetical protein